MSDMTLGAALRRGSLGPLHVSPPAGADPVTTASWTRARTVAMAAGMTGLAEVALLRVGAPVLSHTPLGGVALAEAVETTGRAMLGATALLAPLMVVALAAAAMRRSAVEAVLLVAATGATLAAIIVPAPDLAVTAHVATSAAAVWLAVGALRRAQGWHSLGLALLAVAFVAGRWPLVLDASPGLAAALPVGTIAAASTVAEAALAAAPVLMGLGAVRRAGLSRRAWTAAVVVALIVAAGLITAPEHVAITTMWASGVTLSLPPPVYVLAAFSLGLLAVSWWAAPRTRHLAVGIVLVAIAGIMPGVVHHNLTALGGLALLSVVASARLPVTTGGAHG